VYRLEKERWEAVRKHQKKHGIETVLIDVLLTLGLAAEIFVGTGFFQSLLGV